MQAATKPPQEQVVPKKSDASCLQIIKKMNGFKDSVMKEMDKIETIELVLEDFGSMAVINKFKGLKSLTLINVGVSTIEGLTETVKLEELWLNENSIGKIEGLDKCVNLKSLYISHNQIKHIEGLDNLTQLQTLWLCDNRIESLGGLDKLVKLKQLWVAGNQISYIKTSLDSLTKLTDLNLSGNKICSFKEALNLNRLPNLKVLSFYDPHFGENPICNLCNYQTYVLYHLRNIGRLDTLQISEDAKNFAETTYMRKKMYYNMRIKTMQRSFSTLSKLIKKASLIKVDIINEDLANIHLKLNELGEETKQLEELREIYNLKIDELSHVRAVYESVKKKLFEIDKVCIRKLITELETGGNIRLEEGKPTDKWFASCVDLTNSRFEKDDLANLGISHFKIKRVIRIHNKFLKNKFEEKMETLVDVSSSNTRKIIEYLFYGIDPNRPLEMEHVIEEGFRPPNEPGACPFTPLSNSLLTADLPRLMDYVKSKKNDEKFSKSFIKKRNLGKVVTFPTGSILICKVLMLKQTIDNNYPYFNPELSPTDILQSQPVEVKDVSEYAYYRVKENESKHKLYFILDNNVVIPEYIVEFDYVLQNPNQNHVADFGESVAVLENPTDEFINPKNVQSYAKDINQIYNALVTDVSNYQFDNIDEHSHPNLEIQALELDRMDIGSIKIMMANYFKYCLSRTEAYYALNENLVLQTIEEFDFKKLRIGDFTILKFANLSSLKIKDLGFMKNMPNLEVIILSNNNITNVSDLTACSLVKVLDLNHNLIPEIKPLGQLQHLEYLDLSHNQLTSIDSLKVLEANTRLRQVNVLFNPFVTSEGLEVMLYKTVKTLKSVNHKPLSNLQLEDHQNQLLGEVSDDLLKFNCKLTQASTLMDADWKLSIENLNLTHCRLTSMKGLNQLINLRQLNVGYNFIQNIDFIDKCKLLEELNMEGNKIQKIAKIEGLIYLKKLELGKNKISQIEGIHTLNNLLQLSVEDNSLTSLQEFPELKSLTQLYLGNNKITDSKEIKNIRNLQKLIILDLSGNPFSRDSSYRMFTLYILKKLKVLDGISIEPLEQQQAREHFTGRLTDEILKDKLQDKRADEVTELDLSNCRLKDFEDMFNHKLFPRLTELNLANNDFTSVKMLGYLPNLTILILQSNKIESLYWNTDLSVQKGLNGCQKLEILDVSKNFLKDFNGLQFCRLSELKIIKAINNEISKVDCLENLKSLRELDVNSNKIKQFDPNSFEGKNPIKCLKIEDNGLRSFNNIQKLARLQHLFANSNRINQFHDIEKLCELPYLKELELNGNSLYRKPGYRTTLIRKLPSLIFLDSKEITPQERVDPQSAPSPGNMPPIYIPQMNQRQVPVRLSSVNFEGVFTSNKLGMESLLSQNLYTNQQQPPKRP